MPFRSDERAPAPYTPADPLARFTELHAALNRERRWFHDPMPLRLAAICLLSTPGDGETLAAATRRHDAALRARISWLTGVNIAIRMLLAAQMVKHDDEPGAFLDEVTRVQALLRAASLRRAGVYEFLCVLVLRRVLGATPIDRSHVERLRDIYEAMKRHHWWLTGPNDLPACAMLLTRPEQPTAIGDGSEAMYRALHERAGLWRGEALHSAAHLLYLGGAEPAEMAERFALLRAGFRAGGARIGQDQYDELATLCLLAWPVERLMSTVLDYRRELLKTQRWLGKAAALNLASSLAFVRIVGVDGALGPLADAKLLLDMQTLIVRQAAGGA